MSVRMSLFYERFPSELLTASMAVDFELFGPSYRELSLSPGLVPNADLTISADIFYHLIYRFEAVIIYGICDGNIGNCSYRDQGHNF